MYEKTIKKYTDTDVDFAALGAANKPLYRVLARLAFRLESTETSLAREARRLRDIADRIDQNLTAGPGDRVVSLNSLGELQSMGSNVDRLIGVRAELIETLHVVIGNFINE